MREKTQSVVNWFVRIIGSRYFLWGIVALFVLQSLWIAFSFNYPMVYDESFHFSVTEIFSNYLTPFITNQPAIYDKYGSLFYGDASLFHYIMSFPYRLVSLFTKDIFNQVVFLRIINIAMVAGGLLLFSKLFNKAGIKSVFVNIGLLVFTLLPIVSFVAATINYDNMLFLITAWYLVLCLQVIIDKKSNWINQVAVIIVGCLASLVKYTFLPIFAASLIFLAIVLFRRHGKRYWVQIVYSFKQSSKLTIIIMTILAVITVGSFSLRYIQAVIKYGSPRPDCSKVMVEEKCLYSIDQRNKIALETKDQRPPDGLTQYATNWFFNNLTITNRASAWVGANTQENPKPLPVMDLLLFFSIFISIGSLLYTWRFLDKNLHWYFLLTMVLVLSLSIFMTNYSMYNKYHVAFATQPRYFLSIAPIIIVMSVVAVNFILRKMRWIKLVLLLVVMSLFLQGGGVITHIMLSNDTWYWQKPKIIEANHKVKKILQLFVWKY